MSKSGEIIRDFCYSAITPDKSCEAHVSYILAKAIHVNSPSHELKFGAIGTIHFT